MKTQRFDMEQCLKERKGSDRKFTNSRDTKLGASIHISGAPDNLSKFRTRVVLNECLTGKPLQKALDRALSIVDKRPISK